MAAGGIAERLATAQLAPLDGIRRDNARVRLEAKAPGTCEAYMRALKCYRAFCLGQAETAVGASARGTASEPKGTG
eukprot:gene2668-1731_t